MTTQNTMEELMRQFDEEFPNLLPEMYREGFRPVVNREDVRMFIQKSLASARALGIKESMEVVEEQEQKLTKRKCLNAESHLFGSCFSCEKIKGNNEAVSNILTSLSQLITPNQDKI